MFEDTGRVTIRKPIILQEKIQREAKSNWNFDLHDNLHEYNVSSKLIPPKGQCSKLERYQ